MYDMMDAEYFVACLYFIVIVIVMNFWLLNLFVAVINEMFAKIREDTQHSAFTTSKYEREKMDRVNYYGHRTHAFCLSSIRATTVLADAEGGWSFGDDDSSRKTRKSLLQEWIAASKPLWILLVVVDLVVMAIKNNDMTEDQVSTLGTSKSRLVGKRASLKLYPVTL